MPFQMTNATSGQYVPGTTADIETALESAFGVVPQIEFLPAVRRRCSARFASVAPRAFVRQMDSHDPFATLAACGCGIGYTRHNLAGNGVCSLRRHSRARTFAPT